MNVYVKKDPELRDMFLILRGPNYYDSPEGKNPFEKIWALSKYAIFGSTFAGLGDCLFISQTKNVIQTMNTFGYYMVPSVSLCAMWASATFMATNIRGKDDKWNYAIGVAACVPVLWAFKPKEAFVVPSTIFLLAAALIKKDSIQNGWKFFPGEFDHHYDTYFHDYSLVKAEWPRRPY